jgi:AcrR family transcriptional regulator
MSVPVISYDRGMVRWEPGSRGRLEQAAMALFGEQGYEQTTVAEIAERAGVTERTFFRHFADKREVLFSGAGEFEQTLVGGTAAAAASLAPLDAAAAGIEAAAAMLQDRRDFARQRQRIIAASPELRERELIKMASLAEALAATLRERGVIDPGASLTADVAIAVFTTAFERWIEAPADPDFVGLIRDSLEELRGITAGLSRPALA